MPPPKQPTWRFHVHNQIAIEHRAEHPDPVITGLGAVYYDGTKKTEFQLYEGAVERIMPGAFTRALEERQDVMGLFNHDKNQILGRVSAGTMKLSDTKAGLVYEVTPPATTVGRDVLENVRVRNVTGSSFSFNVKEERWTSKDGQEIREVLDVDLFDVGPVVFPAYEAATVEAASDDGKRSYGIWMARRELTKADDWLKVRQLPAKGQAP